MSREELHRSFGGVIYESDFETDYRGKDQESSSIASRIVADQKREKMWRSGKKGWWNSWN